MPEARRDKERIQLPKCNPLPGTGGSKRQAATARARWLNGSGYNRAMNRPKLAGTNWRLISQVPVAALTAGGERPVAGPVQQRLADFWPGHLGAAGMHSWPLLFTSGRLVVFVEAAAWGHEIRHRAPGLLDDLGRHGISARTITVKMHPPSPPPPPRKPRARLRLSPHSARHIAQLAESIAHPPLARALISLAKRASGKAEAETSEGGGNEHAPGASPAPHTSATVRTKAIGSSASSS